jgi:hypothetical protein
MITIISCNSKPKTYGCTESSAINYNPVAELMKDSSCIQRTYVETENKSKIYIDHKKYNNVHYKFVYNINDTINDEFIKSYDYSSEKNNYYYFRNIKIQKIDTIFYNSSNMNNKNIGDLYLPIAKNIQVFEILDEKIKNTYYIDIDQSKYLINPFKNYRYKINQTEYTTLAFGIQEYFNPIKFSAFLNEINYKIDYWFEDPPKEIMMGQYQLSEKKYDISRY